MSVFTTATREMVDEELRLRSEHLQALVEGFEVDVTQVQKALADFLWRKTDHPIDESKLIRVGSDDEGLRRVAVEDSISSNELRYIIAEQLRPSEILVIESREDELSLWTLFVMTSREQYLSMAAYFYHESMELGVYSTVTLSLESIFVLFPSNDTPATNIMANLLKHGGIQAQGMEDDLIAVMRESVAVTDE